MEDTRKSKAQLIEEVVELRQLVASLEFIEADRKRNDSKHIEENHRFGPMVEQITGSQIDILTSVVDQSEESIVIIDLAGYVQYANSTFFRLNLLSPEGIIGKNWRSFLSTNANLWEKFPEIRDTVLNNGKQWKGEVIDRLPDGEIIWREAKLFPIKNNEGDFTHVVYTSMDITDRKKAEIALQDSERRSRLLIENIPTVARIFAPNGEVHFITDNIQKVCAYSAGEILAGRETFWFEIIHPNDLKRVQAEMERFFYTRTNYKAEYRIQRKDSQWIWILDCANVVEDIDGQKYAYGVFSDISDRKQSEEALELYIERLKIMYQINQGILIAQSPMEIAKIVLRWIRPLIPCSRAGVTLLEPTNNLATLIAVDTDGETKITPSNQLQLDIFPGLETIERLRHRQIVQLNIIPTEKVSKTLFSEGIRSYVIVPLISEGDLIGSLNFGWSKPYDLTGVQQEIAREAAAQLSIAISQAQLHEDEKRRRTELELLEQISTALRQANNLNDLYTILGEQFKILFRSDASAIFIPRNRRIECDFIGGSEKLKNQLFRTNDITNALAQILISDTPTFYPGKAFGLEGISSTALLPFQSQFINLGGLVLFWSEKNDFPEEERRLLNIVTDVAGIALHRMNILDMLEQRIEDRTRALSALYEVTSVSIRSLDLQEILDQSLQKVVDAMVSEMGFIYLLDESGQSLQLISHREMKSRSAQDVINFARNYRLADEVLQRKKAIVNPDLPVDSHLSNLADEDLRSPSIGVPIRTKDRILGVLTVVGMAESSYGEEEVSLLTSIADQIGIAIENTQLNKQARQAAILSERHRFARDLHDSLTQSLYSLNLMAATGQKLLENGGDKAKIIRTLKRLGMTAHQALKEMRLLLFELRPFTLEKEGLVGALRQRLEAVERRAEIDVQLHVDDLPNLPPGVEEGLYFIAQEALNNSLKHADSSKIEVVIRWIKDCIELEIRDFGKGFELRDQDHGQGMGLASMRERAEALDGELKITSAPGAGTCVNIQVKIAEVGDKWPEKFAS